MFGARKINGVCNPEGLLVHEGGGDGGGGDDEVQMKIRDTRVYTGGKWT